METTPAPVPTPTPAPEPQRVVIKHGSGGPGFLVRALWFVFIGSWLSGLAILVAYLACLTLVGLPLGFAIFNRLPAILTLRGRTQTTEITSSGNLLTISGGKVEQRPMWLRALWFLLLGWWLGAIYMAVAWALCIVIIGLPIGLLMFNRVGAVMTLLRY